MANPTGGSGIGQAAGELLKEMQKAQAEVQVEAKTKASGPNQGFQQAMQAQQQTASFQNQQGQLQSQAHQQAGVRDANVRVQTDNAVTTVVKDQRTNLKLASTRVGATEKSEESRLTKMLSSLLTGQDKMTKIMNMALSGRQFSPSELLAMQAGVYRFTQELDLTSKVVEKATGGIKQTLNTQV